jgi:hypothetical protein
VKGGLAVRVEDFDARATLWRLDEGLCEGQSIFGVEWISDFSLV